MKKILVLLFGAALLAGCSSSYVITLNNRSQVTASTKPKLKEGVYYYKDSQGRDSFLSAGRVAEISPSSMMEKNQFSPASKK
jgi:hypothetical protein